ncbi:MAG: TolC family protein, partial [Burkholderiaceae bacterium]
MTNAWPVAYPPIQLQSIDQTRKQRRGLALHLHCIPLVLARQVALAILLGLLLLMSPLLGRAESTPDTEIRIITLDELVNTVLQHNAGLNAARRTVDIATASITTATAYPNPRLELNGGRGSALTPGTSSGSIVGIGVSQVIENPALRSARINSALFAEQGSQQAFATTRNELVGVVRLRANEYLLRKLQAREAAESLSLLEQTRERIKVRVETGETGKLDLIRADAEIINARQREETARLQIAQAAIALNRLAAGMLPSRWELEGNLEDTRVLPTLDQLRAEATQFNPEVRFLEAELERTQSRLQEANASVIPGIELRASQLREPDIRNDMIGLSVQIPLLDQRRGPKAEAAADRERTRGRLEGRRAELIQQLELSRRAVDIATVRVKALSEGAVRSSEAALRVAEAAYRFGERGILEVLDAQRVLRAVRQDLLLARYELQSALIELDVLTGRYAAEK